MATEVRIRRGTTAQHAGFTGAAAEITVDTDKDTIVVHDGVTAGGFPLGKETVLNGKASSGANSDITSLSGLTTPLSIAQGGTSANSAATARTALGAAASGALGSSGITGAAASGANNDITSLTALTAGGLPDNSVLTADIANAQITAAKLNGAQSGSAPIFGIRAFVAFNGTGAVSILNSGNVSSITDHGTGEYTVNFTTPLPASYAFVGTAGDGSGSPNAYVTGPTGTPTTSAFRFCVRNDSATLVDQSYIFCLFIG
jgi:hypothetical protein